MDKTTSDPANYRRCSEPFVDQAAGNEALEKFYDAVLKARNELRIKDVHVIVKFSVLLDGEENEAVSSAHYGNQLEAAPMCAWAYSREQKDLNDSLGRALSGKLER